MVVLTSTHVFSVNTHSISGSTAIREKHHGTSCHLCRRHADSYQCVALAAIICLCLYFAAPISRMLGIAGMNIVTRIMGIVLTVIAFQMLTAGLK
jgi:small neutral amino acid transporter SnatA (MarC family)